MKEASVMTSRPAVRMICYTDAGGNPQEIWVDGRVTYNGDVVTEIREVEEYGEFCAIPWVEIYSSDKLLARFCQHRLDRVFYV